MSDELPIGGQLRQARIRAQVSIGELSEKGRIGRQTIKDVEANRMPPSERIVSAYTDVCGLSKTLGGDTLFVNADKTPPDVFAMIKEDPHRCEIFRQIVHAELQKEGG